MSNGSGNQWLRPHSFGDDITEIAIPLIAMRAGGEELPSGTAFFVGPWFAITAAHVLEDYSLRYDGRLPAYGETPSSFEILSFQVLDSGRGILPLRVHRLWFAPPLDIAFLHMVPAAEYDAERPWKVPALALLPPSVGDRITAFGYPGSRLIGGTGERKVLHQRPSSSPGVVREVHDEQRDRTVLPFPVFRSDARFDGGMSGGPVFSPSGELCGVVCRSFTLADDEADNLSYASSLWPAVATLVDLEWDRYRRGTFFPVLELIQAGFLHARHADRVRIAHDADGARVVEVYDPRGSRIGVERAPASG